MNTINIDELKKYLNKKNNKSYIHIYPRKFICKTRKFGKFAVMGYINNRKMFRVKFIETGYTRKASLNQIIKGYIRDPYYPIIYDIGYKGAEKHIFDELKSRYSRGVVNIIYKIWKELISKCYNPLDPNYRKYGLKGYTINKHWHSFNTFFLDILELPNFNTEKLMKYNLVLNINPNEKEFNKLTAIWLNREGTYNDRYYTN